MKGTRIIITSKPRGVFEDVYITGTPSPGSLMELKPSTAAVGGLFNYQLAGTQADSSGQYMAEDGDRKSIAILLEYDQEGGIYSRAYVAGELGRVYWPAMGEQFNMRIGNISGTGDDYIIGTELMIDENTNVGMLMPADANAEAHPFTCLEVNTDVTVEFLAWCRFNGAGGA